MTPPLFEEMQAVLWTPTINTTGPVEGIIVGRRWQAAHPDEETGELLPSRWVYKVQGGDEQRQYDVEVVEERVQPR